MGQEPRRLLHLHIYFPKDLQASDPRGGAERVRHSARDGPGGEDRARRLQGWRVGGGQQRREGAVARHDRQDRRDILPAHRREVGRTGRAGARGQARGSLADEHPRRAVHMARRNPLHRAGDAPGGERLPLPRRAPKGARLERSAVQADERVATRGSATGGASARRRKPSTNPGLRRRPPRRRRPRPSPGRPSPRRRNPRRRPSRSRPSQKQKKTNPGQSQSRKRRRRRRARRRRERTR